MPNVTAADVLSSVSLYIENNNRPCPAHYLVTKYSDDVMEVIGIMKQNGTIVGKRGRNGGLILPDTVFKPKSTDKVVEQSVESQNQAA